MKLTLDRRDDDGTTTVGELYIDGAWQCFTLEDTHREEKLQGETRIPAGTYEIELRTVGGFHARYDKFYDFHRGMLQLRDVPGFEYILIHTGNYHTNTKGCILVGQGRAKANGTSMVTQSRAAYQEFYPKVAAALLAGEPVTIEIIENEIGD